MSDIAAGKYELVALFWEEPLSKPGEPYNFVRHVRGDVVDLNVEEARRLVQAGAVVEPGARERAAAEFAQAQYEAALAALPDAAREKVTAATDAAERPPQTAPKAAWVDHAVTSAGMDPAEAEAMTKQDIIAAVPPV